MNTYEIDDPAVASAIAVCWLVQKRRGVQVVEAAASERHGLRCAWCDYPPDVLLGWIVDFLEDPGTKVKVELFERLAHAEQKRRVLIALHPEEVPV